MFSLLVCLKPGKWGGRTIIWSGCMAFGTPLLSRIAESLSDWLFYLLLLGITTVVFVLLAVRDGKWDRAKGD